MSYPYPLASTPTKGGEQTMRKSLWLISAALSYGSGAFAQETLSADITVQFNRLQNSEFKGKDGEWVGAKGGVHNLTFLNIKKRSGPKDVNIQYRCKFYYYGETEWKRESEDCGIRGEGRILDEFAIRLTGEGAKKYRLAYKCRVRGKDVETDFRVSPRYCSTTEPSRGLEALFIKVEPLKPNEYQPYEDDEIVVQPFRLMLENPPKVAFVVRVFASLSSFYIAYQRADAAPSDPPKVTAAVTVGPGDTRAMTMASDKQGFYGNAFGLKDELISEALAPDTEYVYWLVGKYRDVSNKSYTSPKLNFKTVPLQGLNLEEGILTGEASLLYPGRTTVVFAGGIGKPKGDGVAYIEYGTNPNQMDHKTSAQGFSEGNGISYRIEENLLQPQTKYFYRLVAEYANGQKVRGGTMSVTFPNLPFKKENPCEGRLQLAPDQMATRLSENLVVVCSSHQLAGSLYQGSGIEGQLVCPEQFPRNLNTTPLDLKIPKVDIGVSIERKGVGFMRSSDDVRFNDAMFWQQQGEEGQQQPVRQGSQKYAAINWTPQTQTLIVWIYCSNNWSQPNTFK
jgi:hypothetical protein